MDAEAIERFERVIRNDGRYPLEAYEFLNRGLEAATQMVYGEEPPTGARHVTGQQLCKALQSFALDQWGLLARDVLDRWNIRGTRDFGEMVFLLVGEGFMGKRDSDRIEDFDDVFNFEQGFGTYKIELDGQED